MRRDFFYKTAIYAFNHENQRTELWDALSSFSQLIKDPWVVLGDFNTFMRHHGRVKNGIEVGGHTSELLNLYVVTGLGDLHYSCCFLTWCNNQEGASRTYTKLDRVLINIQWFSKFQHSQVVFLPHGISDHSPAIVYFPTNLPYKAFPFRFCNVWGRDEKFLSIVHSVWRINI